MATTATSEIVQAIVERLLAYVSDSGQMIATLTSSRVYVTQAPDNTAHPYVVVRTSNKQSDPEYGNLRQTFDAECVVYNRPRHLLDEASGRTREQTAELIADLVEQALLTWRESSSTLGLTYGQFSDRDTEPPPLEEVDRDLVAIPVVVRCASWPRYMTDALT